MYIIKKACVYMYVRIVLINILELQFDPVLTKIPSSAPGCKDKTNLGVVRAGME